MKKNNILSDWLDEYGDPKIEKKVKLKLEEMNKETYSIPIYENGIKTEWTIDGMIGDEKYQQLIEMTPEKKLPNMINVNLKQNKYKNEK